MNTGGIIDLKNNPFAIPSDIIRSCRLTNHRQDQLELILGKRIEQINSMNRNKGRYVAFVAIRWGFAKIVDGKLDETEKWNNLDDYDEYGRPKA